MKAPKEKKMKWYVVPVFLLVILLAVSVVRAYATKNILSGVSAGHVKLARLSVDEASERLKDRLHDDAFDSVLHLELGNMKKTVKPSDFLATYDYKKTAEDAIEIGHKGGFFKRIGAAFSTIFVRKNILPEISYDETAYADILHALLDDVGEKVQEYSYEIQDDKLIVTNGKPGLLPDEKSVSDAIVHAIRAGNYADTISFDKETRMPTEVNAETLYDEVFAEAADASYAIEDGKVVIHPHVVGVKFNKDAAQKIINENKEYGESFEIPLEIEEPEITIEDIENKLFSDVIGEYQTSFNTGDVSRSKNIALAANKINGTILAPGEVFSYNDTVGERSYSEGFETAKVYVNGEAVDGVGGGICQVSSTLFNAVVYANLEIVERVNHQLTVSYVPLGRDATVDYGNIDFRFRNSTNYPIKLAASASGGTMYAAIYGYREDASQKVSFETATIGHTDPPVKKTNDPTLPKGEEKVKSAGTSGYVVDTYKIVQRDGKPDEKVYLCRSTYMGHIREVLVGTGDPMPSPSPSPDTKTPEVTSPSTTQDMPVSTPAPTPVPTPAQTTVPAQENEISPDDISSNGL